MSARRRIVVLVVVMAAAFGAARLTFAFLRFSTVERSFGSIHDGESREAVVTLIGKPNYYAGACGVIHFPTKNCALEYVYSHPFVPLIPQYYIVSFSSDNRVIEASTWSSP